MKKRFHKVLFLVTLTNLLLLQGCFLYGKKDMLSLDSVVKVKENLNSNLTSVNVSNNQMTINGSGLGKATSVKIVGNAVDADLNILSVSDSQIIVTAKSALSLMVGGAFNLIIGTVDAQTTYPITFTLQNGAVDSINLASMSATAGQVLKFNGIKWLPTSQIDAQTYIGTWDATTTILPDVTLSNQGDYFIVSVAGAGYAVGDWIISDGYTWTKVAYSKTSVSSFQGRKGIVTLVPADYISLKDGTSKIPGSKLADIADINLAGILDGQFLKWDQTSSKWIPGAITGGPAGIALTDLSASSPLSYNSGTGAFSLSAANILALPLDGLAVGSGSIADTDSILAAFGKLKSVPTDYISKTSGATVLTGTIALTGASMLTIAAPPTLPNDVTNVTYVTNAIAANGVWNKGASTSINYVAGNVGIGTATPTQPLDVAAASPSYNVVGRFTNTSGGGAVVQSDTYGSSGAGFSMNVVGSNSWQMVADGGGATSLSFSATNNLNTYTPVMLLSSSGNVGIGPAAPIYNLSFLGNSNQTIAAERNTTANTAGSLFKFMAAGAASGATNKAGGTLNLSAGTSTGTGTSQIIFQTSSAGSSGTTDNTPTTKMTILGNGAVGIGYSPWNDFGVYRANAGVTADFISDNISTNAARYPAMRVLNFAGSPATGSVGNPSFSLINMRGTSSVSAAMRIGEPLGTFIFNGGSDTSGNYKEGASIWATATENFSSTNSGANLTFYTTTNGTSTSTPKMTLNHNGRVGIGLTDPDYKLDVDGDVNIAAANVLRFGGTQVCASAGCAAVSDRRLKEDIQPLQNSLDKILKLQGVSYDWIDKEKYGQGQQVGLIAQDLEKVYPQAVVTDQSSGLKSVAYDHLVAPLIEAFKSMNARLNKLYASFNEVSAEQLREIASVKAENAKLKANDAAKDKKIKEIEQRLEKIEKALNSK